MGKRIEETDEKKANLWLKLYVTKTRMDSTLLIKTYSHVCKFKSFNYINDFGGLH